MGQPLRIQKASEESVRAEQESARLRVLLKAIVHSGANQFPVTLRSVSRTGALIGSAVIPPVGSLVRFERGPVSVSGRVIWAGRSGFELEFREAIDEHELLIVIDKLEISEPLKPLFPIDRYFGHSDLDDEDDGNRLPISKH
jgi:hypothetical protein